MVSQERLKMLLNSFANISLCLLYGFPIAEATRQRWAICQVSDIFSFFFDDDLKGVVVYWVARSRQKYITSVTYLHSRLFASADSLDKAFDRTVELMEARMADERLDTGRK